VKIWFESIDPSKKMRQIMNQIYDFDDFKLKSRCCRYLLMAAFIALHSGGFAQPLFDSVAALYRQDIIYSGNLALKEAPVTVTATRSQRSVGGPHDFFSEGDYWWPNPVHADSPYIQRDGLTNPDNFLYHRRAMVRFSRLMGDLASAWLITGETRYVRHAMRHARAWFSDTTTRMNPSLLYAQAIKGRVTGRSIGVIDMIQMMEVAQSLHVLRDADGLDGDVMADARRWFSDYIQWVTSHPYGIQEAQAKNNHGTCWVMQVAVFARFTDNKYWMDSCRRQFKQVLLPGQLDSAGRFPLELARTKPYGYSLFNLDAMSTICHVLTTAEDDLWDFTLPDGRTMRRAIEFMYPYVADKSLWPYKQDVMYWPYWPVAHPHLLFSYVRYRESSWLKTWKSLPRFPRVEEVIRNLPVRHPILWIAP
jgi:hypothetical protein